LNGIKGISVEIQRSVLYNNKDSFGLTVLVLRL